MIYSASRMDTESPFGGVAPVAELNRDKRQFPVWISADGCKIYLGVFTPTAAKTILRFAQRPAAR